MVALVIGFAAQSLVLRDMVPLGGILSWSGAIVDIPSNYQLCDGTNGTPDLRDKFIVGAGSNYAVDAVGGAVNHDHTMDSVPDLVTCGTEANVMPINGSTAAASNLPPYLALAHIQRMS